MIQSYRILLCHLFDTVEAVATQSNACAGGLCPPEDVAPPDPTCADIGTVVWYVDHCLVPQVYTSYNMAKERCQTMGGRLQWFDATDDFYFKSDQFRYTGGANQYHYTG